jgi:aryl-alcohol dehydrogenase-like predicted oxidoreductase
LIRPTASPRWQATPGLHAEAGQRVDMDSQLAELTALRDEGKIGAIGLAWLLAEYEGTLLIPGTANPEHLAENIAAGGVRLGPDVVAGLGRLAGQG